MPSRATPQSAGARVLRFLDDHWLDHSPAHYGFAHRFLFGDDSALRHEVGRITDGGVRITPEQVATLADDGDAAAAAAESVAPRLDLLTLRFLDIVTGAAEATGSLNQDLVLATASMLGPNAPSIELIVAAMIERTAQAEASMAETSRRAQSLRDELNTARNDAVRDRLTGLLNRVAIEERLARALARPGGCAIALVDIDRFRAINDTHGHGVGDRVLKVVAETLREHCAPHPVSRWGGEEFLILFEGLSATDAGVIVERAREALTERQLKLREDDTPIGAIAFSAGVASSRSREAALVIEAGDRLLHQAKAQGRNRVMVEPLFIGVEPREAASGG